jgi:UDP-2,3-diacylglucosamine pyrophosphatase LpxH
MLKKKDFIKKNTGQDKLRGRPIRLNKKKLEMQKGEDHAELLFFGDVHIGYPTSNLMKAKAMLDYALKNRVYVILMGDLIEAGIKDSIGDSNYRQRLNPQKQMETAINLLEPIANAGLIIGLHSGNHEKRITNATGIDVSKIMAKLLNVSYLGYACWSVLSIGKIRYSLYSEHGSSGSKFKHTKLKAIMDQSAWINSDILAMGHVHSIASEVILKQYFDRHINKVIEAKQYVVLTGSYLEWDGSYAQEKNYPISKIGSPKAKLSGKRRDVHFSL